MKVEKFIEDFSTALERLGEALSTPAESDLMRAGCIQYYLKGACMHHWIEERNR